MSRAFVFPGQGAQTIGMGKALAASYPSARAVFDEVDEALGERLSALIWEGDPEALTLTENAQPALMATSLAALRALQAEGVSIDDAAFVAGHSLGELSFRHAGTNRPPRPRGSHDARSRLLRSGLSARPDAGTPGVFGREGRWRANSRCLAL